MTVTQEAMAKNYPWTSEQLAQELDMSLASYRVWKNKLEKSEKLTKPKVGSLLCIKDPDMGTRLLYSDKYLEKLKEVRTSGPKRAKHGKAVSKSVLSFKVNIFDNQIASFLMSRFKTEENLEAHVKNELEKLAKPSISKMDELRRKYEEEMQKLISLEGENI